MTVAERIDCNALRARFARALSRMYRAEVPAYGTLVSLVEDVNAATLDRDRSLAERLRATGGLDRISEERHGAIRLGTAAELAGMGRLFAGFGMAPVGYYDLGVAGIPVHSTAFRPIGEADLAISPFRVFTSLLRTEAIADERLRREAEHALEQRSIFHGRTLALADRSVWKGGLCEREADELIDGAVETFRWRGGAAVGADIYASLKDVHALIADVVSFAGPHINHLTPRTLDIDAVQRLMPERGVRPKAVVEGPPPRDVPILLRQTSFKAIEERVAFPDGAGGTVPGAHTARFGEVEQRGAALTPKGRALYDRLLAAARQAVRPAPDGSNAAEYDDALRATFTEFPDDTHAMEAEGLAYFRYDRVEGRRVATPIVYEDFLPISAAGIFQSNLGDDVSDISARSARASFERALGAPVLDEFALYAARERDSLERCGADRRVHARG